MVYLNTNTANQYAWLSLDEGRAYFNVAFTHYLLVMTYEMTGEQLAQVVEAEAHALEGAGREVLEHGVSGLDEPLDHLAPTGVPDVGGHASLVPAHVVEHAGAVERRPVREDLHAVAHGVQIGLVLDADYVRAQVGHDPGALRPGHDP